jgi:alpha-N-acetylglucosaminidase
MINIKSWGGGLPTSWIDGQETLQHRILERERSLGMTPVLPGFAGGVPEAMQTVHPEALYSRHGNWGGFSEENCCVLMVAPKDPLFREIGRTFVQEVINTYGTDHIYSCDTFNENRPTASAGYMYRDFVIKTRTTCVRA